MAILIVDTRITVIMPYWCIPVPQVNTTALTLWYRI